MRHLFYLHNLPLPDKVAAQKKKIKNKIPARLYIYFPYGEISKNGIFKTQNMRLKPLKTNLIYYQKYKKTYNAYPNTKILEESAKLNF